MKRMLSLLVAGGFLLGGSMAFAGSACCPASSKTKTEAKAAKSAGCGDVLSKLNLTEDQKKKIAELKTACDKGGCTEESTTKFMKGLKDILTAEQLAQCKIECEKAGGCPISKADSKI